MNERTREGANDGIRMLQAARARERRVRACAALDNCGRPGSQHALPNLPSHVHGGGVIQGPHFHIILSRFEVVCKPKMWTEKRSLISPWSVLAECLEKKMNFSWGKRPCLLPLRSVSPIRSFEVLPLLSRSLRHHQRDSRRLLFSPSLRNLRRAVWRSRRPSRSAAAAAIVFET